MSASTKKLIWIKAVGRLTITPPDAVTTFYPNMNTDTGPTPSFLLHQTSQLPQCSQEYSAKILPESIKPRLTIWLPNRELWFGSLFAPQSSVGVSTHLTLDLEIEHHLNNLVHEAPTTTSLYFH